MYPGFNQEWVAVEDRLQTRLGKRDYAVHNSKQYLKFSLAPRGWDAKVSLRERWDLGPDGRRWIQVVDLVDAAPPEATALGHLELLLEAARAGGHLPVGSRGEIREMLVEWAKVDRYGRDLDLMTYLKKVRAYPWLVEQFPYEIAGVTYQTFENLWTNAGVVRSLLKKWFCLSANPVDVLLASEFVNFTSCFKIGTGRSVSLLSYLVSPFTMIAYIANDQRFDELKVARAWVFNDQIDHVVLGRMYGDMHYLTKAIARYLVPKHITMFGVKYPADLLEGAETNAAYKRHNVWVDAHKDMGFVASGPASPGPFRSLTFKSARCIGCGGDELSSDDGAPWLCKNCQALKWLCVGTCGKVYDRNRKNPNLRVCKPCSKEMRARQAEMDARREAARARQAEQVARGERPGIVRSANEWMLATNCTTTVGTTIWGTHYLAYSGSTTSVTTTTGNWITIRYDHTGGTSTRA